GAPEVGADDVVPLLLARLQRAVAVGIAAHEGAGVDSLEGGANAGEGLSDLGHAAQVAAEDVDPHAVAAEFRGGVVGALMEIDQRQAGRSGFSDRLGGRAPDAARSARDDGDFSLHVHRSGPGPSSASAVSRSRCLATLPLPNRGSSASLRKTMWCG